jgi:hypothetical protein
MQLREKKKFYILLKESYQCLELQSYFLLECCSVLEAVTFFINDKKPIGGSGKGESLQEDC